MTTSLLIIAGLAISGAFIIGGWKAAAHLIAITGLLYITAGVTLSL